MSFRKNKMGKINASIGIVIVNYNGAKYQNDCLQSIYDLNYENIKIIIVDSNSSDNSIELVKSEFGSRDNIVILEQSYNCGVAKGNNIGIQYCIQNELDYVMLLNNDVELDSHLLETLLNNVDDTTIVVPKIYFYEPKKMLWFAGGNIDWRKGESKHRGIREIDNGQYDEITSIDYAPTCCMLLKTEVFKKVGMIDETVFMYYDDTDLCVRIIECGYKILYIPDAIMWHKVSSSTGGENSKIQVYYMSRNQLYFLKKHRDKTHLFTKLYIYIKGIAKVVLAKVRGKKNDQMIIKGFADFYKNKMGRKEF